MSERVNKEKEESGAQGFYVYCVGERTALAPLFDVDAPGAIEDERDLELIEADGLVAVLSRVPLADYAEEALAERLKDATWTATRAIRHERVVEYFARRAAVVLLRFGTIYLRRASVAGMLTERGAQMRAGLARLDGRVARPWRVGTCARDFRTDESVERARRARGLPCRTRAGRRV